jgi:hypothetical protein
VPRSTPLGPSSALTAVYSVAFIAHARCVRLHARVRRRVRGRARYPMGVAGSWL